MDRRQVLIGGGALAVAGASGVALSVVGMGSMRDYTASVAETRATLGARPDLRALVRFASLAPNGHNTQPWRFRLRAGRIDILPDFSRRTPVVDPDDHHLFVSLGAAAETLAIAAASRGLPGELAFDARDGGSVTFRFAPGSARPSALFDAIPLRQSTRADYDDRPVATADLAALAQAAAMPGIALSLLTDRPRIGRARDLVIAGNDAQMGDAAFLRELKHWLRFNPRKALRVGDGLFSVASGNPALPDWLGPLMFDLAFSARSEGARYARQIDSSAGIAVFVAERADPAHWVRVGRACQRFALRATALGLKLAFVNQPVEVPRLRPELASLIEMPGRRPDIVLRFGHGPRLPYSARRGVATILV